jgi:hypothetical protein
MGVSTKFDRFGLNDMTGWTITFGLATYFVFAATLSSSAHAADGHPARIHEGTCDALGRAAYRLNGVGASVDLAGMPLATPTTVNPAKAYQIMVSDTVIDAPLQALLTGEHVLMIYASDEAMDAVACGNIGGAMIGDTLITGLAETGVAGHTGFAIFRPEGDKTDIEVIIGHGLSPVSAASAGGAATAGSGGMNMDMGLDMTMGDNSSDATPTPPPAG